MFVAAGVMVKGANKCFCTRQRSHSADSQVLQVGCLSHQLYDLLRLERVLFMSNITTNIFGLEIGRRALRGFAKRPFVASQSITFFSSLLFVARVVSSADGWQVLHSELPSLQFCGIMRVCHFILEKFLRNNYARVAHFTLHSDYVRHLAVSVFDHRPRRRGTGSRRALDSVHNSHAYKNPL